MEEQHEENCSLCELASLRRLDAVKVLSEHRLLHFHALEPYRSQECCLCSCNILAWQGCVCRSVRCCGLLKGPVGHPGQ